MLISSDPSDSPMAQRSTICQLESPDAASASWAWACDNGSKLTIVDLYPVDRSVFANWPVFAPTSRTRSMWCRCKPSSSWKAGLEAGTRRCRSYPADLMRCLRRDFMNCLGVLFGQYHSSLRGSPTIDHSGWVSNRGMPSWRRRQNLLHNASDSVFKEIPHHKKCAAASETRA